MANPFTISEKALLLAEERRFWQTVDDIARPFRDKQVHNYAKRMIKLLGKAILETARDQMTEDAEEEKSEEYFKRLMEEDKKPPSEKISEMAMMNAMLEAGWDGTSPI